MTFAARVGDLHSCSVSGHPGGPILTGCATVLIGYQPAAFLGSITACAAPEPVIEGEPTVLVEHRPAARVGHGVSPSGIIAAGCTTVLIGTPSQAQVLADAAERGTPICEECGG